MPIYKAELRLAWDIPGIAARKWRNTFYYNVSSAAAAASNLSAGWIGFLRNAARERVYCYEVYASSLAPGDDDFVVVQIPTGQQRGTLVMPVAEPYLPKVCLPVTLGVFGSRPSRKFWRPGLTEPDIVAGVAVSGTLVDTIRGVFNDFVADITPSLVDPDGELLTGVQRITLSTREFGRESTVDVPLAPPLG